MEMTQEEIAKGLVREQPKIVKVFDWLRRHFVIHIGKHGEKSIDIGVKVEF